jgi:DNA segregation ATPase FtsK/SpoIIIE-like protein
MKVIQTGYSCGKKKRYTGSMAHNDESKDRKKMLEALDKIYGQLHTMQEKQSKLYTEISKELIVMFKRISATLPQRPMKAPDEFLDDELYHEAQRLVRKSGIASTSYLQNQLGIDYARARHLIDLLEENHVLSPAVDGKPREVILGGKVEKILKKIEEQLKKNNSKNNS